MTTPVGAKPTETPTAGKADEKAPTADIQPGKNLSESDRHASDKAGRSDKSGTSRSERSEIPVSSKIRHADKPATSEGKKPDRRDSLTSKQPSKGDSLNTGRSRESGSSKSTRSRDARERPGGSRDTKERTTQERRESGHGRDKSGRRSSERSSGRSSRKREDRKKEESSSSHHRSRSREEQSQGQRPGSSRETTSAADARWRWVLKTVWFDWQVLKCRLIPRADYRLATSQWESLLQSNAASHWLGTNLESALIPIPIRSIVGTWGPSWSHQTLHHANQTLWLEMPWCYSVSGHHSQTTSHVWCLWFGQGSEGASTWSPRTPENPMGPLWNLSRGPNEPSKFQDI